MAIPIQFRRGTAAQWTLANPTLAVGELGLETDTAKFKIGNGSAAWVSLAYAFEGIGLSNDAYDAATWNEVTTVAPSKNAVRDAIELRQPLNTNLTAYAEDPKAAILVNMPTPLELDEVPRTVYVVTGAGTSVMNGTYALYSTDDISSYYRKLPFSSEYPTIRADIGGGYMMLSASGVERYQAFGGVPLEDAAWFIGGALTGASPAPSIAISGNAEYIGQTAIVTIGGIKTVWTAVSLTEWKESGSDLTSGPVTSSGGVSAIADGALSIAKTSGLQTSLDGKVDDSQLSTTGGANKVLQLDANGVFRTQPVNSGSIDVPDIQITGLQRINFERPDGANGANIWLFPYHSPSGLGSQHDELLFSAGRHCFYWDDGFQMGNADNNRGNRFVYFRNLGLASAPDPTRESVPVWFVGQTYNGGSPITSQIGMQWVPTGDRSGEFAFGISNNSFLDGANNNKLKSLTGVILPFSITEAGPKVGTSKVLTFGDGSTVSSRSDIAALAVTSVGMPAVRAGSGAMVAGTVAFTPTSGSVTNYTQVSVTRKTIAGTIGTLTYVKTNGTPGTITVNSSSNTDTSVVTYHAVEGSSDAAPPSISGTTSVTDVLTAANNGGSLQWYSNGILVSGQTAATYVIRHEDIGLPITVKEDGVVSNAITAWHPADETGYFADFRADTGTLTTGGGAATNGQAVETWQDQSGNARHLGVLATTNAPLLDTSGTGGRPTFLNFDGSNDYMYRVVATTRPLTVFIVAESKSETPNERFFSTSDSGIRMIVQPSNLSLLDVENNGADTSGDQMSLNVRRILTARTTATQNAIAVDGGTEVVATETTGNGSGLFVAGTSSGSGADQRHYALLVYQADLDTTSRIRVRKYLKAKYGTP